MTTLHQEEMLDLVNEQDEVIGSMERNEVYAKGLTNFRVITYFSRIAKENYSSQEGS